MRLRYWTALTVTVCILAGVALREGWQPEAPPTAPLADRQLQDGPAPRDAEGDAQEPPVDTNRRDRAPDDDMVTWSRTIGPGESLDVLLAEAGLDAPTRAEVSRAIGSEYDLRRLQPGYRLGLEIAADGALHSAMLEVENGTRVQAAFGAAPSVRVVPPALESVTRAGQAEIATTIYAALDDAGIPTRFATDLELILAGTLDLRREVGGGERLRIVWRENRLGTRVIGEPTIDFAELDLGDERYEVLWPGDDSRRSWIYKDDRLVRVFHQPIRGARLSSAFGLREHPIHDVVRMHNGVDFAAEEGSKVVATQSGEIAFMGRRSGYGLMVEIQHPRNVRTIYAHLSATDERIEVGQSIVAGEEIGRVGSSGTSTVPHLHYEVLVDGRPVPPLGDRRLYLADELPDALTAQLLLDEARIDLTDELAREGIESSKTDG